MWWTTDDEVHCGAMLTDQLADDGLLLLHSANDNVSHLVKGHGNEGTL